MGNYYKKKSKNPISQFFLHLCIIEMLIFSGEMRFSLNILGNPIQLPLFLISSIMFYIFTTKRVALPMRNFKILISLIIWVFLCSFVFNSYNNDFTWVSFVIFPLGTCLIVSACNFNEFRNLLLKYLTILSVVSIIVQLGHDYMHLFPVTNYRFNNHDHYLSLGFFVTEWGKNRLASIYWEPGQYQIVLNFILCLFIDELSEFGNLKKIIKKFGVIIIAILMTISTTGYIVFAIIMLTALLNAKISRQRLFSYLFVLVAFLAAGNYMYNSRAIQEKIEQRESLNRNTSYFIRVADNIALLRCTLEKPIVGYGAGSPELKARLLSYGNETSSNGWLNGSSQFGLTYLVFLLICMFFNIKLMYKIKYSILVLLALIISQTGEACLYFPYIYMFTFNFLSYSRDTDRKSLPNYKIS